MTLTILGYLALAVAAVGLEVAGRRPDTRVPTLGTCLAYVMGPPAGRVAALLAWLWVGWHFFAR